MKYSVFVDGAEGTTGLRIRERLKEDEGIELLLLNEDERKDSAKRREMLRNCDAAILCLPDDAAREAVELAKGGGAKLIDTSTAHRIAAGWAYGFPELSEQFRRRIEAGPSVAVPGCHASGFAALVFPLVDSGVLERDIPLSCFSVTGFSGGGKKMIAEYESGLRTQDFDAPRQYATAQSHKHLPEMTAVCRLKTPPVFCPIVADYFSGMVVSVPLHRSLVSASPEQITEIYAERYGGGDVVKVLPFAGENSFLPGNMLSGSDAMEIRVEGCAERMVLTARFDNLGKGASGAALQCMNILLHRPETTGLNI